MAFEKSQRNTLSSTRPEEDRISISINAGNERGMNEKNISPIITSDDLEKWNSSRTIVYRYFATIYSFIILGMSDAAYGALIPYGSQKHWRRRLN